MAFTKITDFITGNNSSNEPEVSKEEEYYTTSKAEYHVQNGVAGSRMMLLELRAYSEAQQVAEQLKNRNAVVVNLKRVTPEVAKRIYDFLLGVIFAIDGKMKKLGGGIFLCTPNNVLVDGEISEDNAKVVKAKKGEEDEAESFL